MSARSSSRPAPPGARHRADRFVNAVRLYVVLSSAIWACKLYALYQSHEIWARMSWLYTAAAALVASAPELVVAAAVSILYFSGVALTRGAGPARWAVDAIALLTAALILILNFVNAELLPRLGAALTVPLIQYSDVFKSDHGREAIWNWTSTAALLLGAALVVLAAVLLWAVSRIVPRLPRWAVLGVLVAGSLLPVLAGALSEPAPAHLSRSGTLTFARSLRHLGNAPFDRDQRAEQPFTLSGTSPGIARGPDQAAFRNVILIILEGAAAQYLDPYGSRHQVMPRLMARSSQAVIARNSYAQSTSSTVALRTILAGRYPWIAPLDLTAELRGASVPMLPKLLSERGLRTAFFHSSDVRFGEADKVLAASGYGFVQDYRGRKCPKRPIADVYSSLGNTDDCTFAQLTRWIEGNRTAPFFATLWTFQSHYPYYSTTPSGNASSKAADLPRAQRDRQRYLGALSEADRLIDGTIARLEALGMANETLIIVTSDHGQVFGERGTYGNGISTYEDSVRIPFILISPRLRPGTLDRLSGQIDVAPTIADALGFEPPRSWDGVSLFTPAAERPIHFLSTTAELVLGYRLRNRKVIANLVSGSTEVFDLDADPEERKDLSPSLPSEHLRKEQAWLAAWASGINDRWSSELRRR